MRRLSSEGHEITVAIVTVGWEPLFAQSQVQQVREEAKAANELLGVEKLRFMELPVTRLHALPEHELNGAFQTLIGQEEPDTVFIPFPGDRHEDHRQIFDACMVALRPTASSKQATRILCYETVSETHWSVPNVEPSFNPQLWVDIADHLPAKLEAMGKYVSQLRPAPDARSLKAIEALATWRGSVMGMEAAETFIAVRECWPAV